MNKLFLIAAALSFAFAAGAYCDQMYSLGQFKERTGVHLSEIYKAHRKCEADHGVGECTMMGMFIPKNYTPEVPKVDLPQPKKWES